MTTQTGKPKTAPWLSPYIMVQDVDKAAAFYNKAFAFNTRELAPGPDGSTCHAELFYKDQLLMLGKQGERGSTVKSPASSNVESPIFLYVYTENVDNFYQQAIQNGAKGLSEPEDMFWGDRMCRIQDLDGYIWSFATHIGEN